MSPPFADLSFCRPPGLSAGREDKSQHGTGLQDSGSGGLPQEQRQLTERQGPGFKDRQARVQIPAVSPTRCGLLTGHLASICQMRRGYLSQWVLVSIKGMVCAKCLACQGYSVKVAVAVITGSSTSTLAILTILTLYNPFLGAFFHGGMAGVCLCVCF